MFMRKIAVIGHFAFGRDMADGQTVKTRVVTGALEERFSAENVLKIDTCGGAKTLLKAPIQVFKALKNAQNVIMFPAHNGLRIYGVLLPMVSRFFKKRKLHYAVIGGWLASFLKDRKFLTKQLKRFDGIYVETNSMKLALEAMGFENIFVMPNCKKLTVLSEDELVYADSEPYKLCTFSRVVREKGMEDAIDAVRRINERAGRTVYTLDIYGPVDSGQTEWFEQLQATMPEYVKYGGVIPFDQSVAVLQNYFVLLFPTRFYTEGVPGTIIDAYASGVPVISSKWENFGDVIEDGITGIGYEFESVDALTECLETVWQSPKMICDMKTNCLKKSKEFMPFNVIEILVSKT